MTIGEICNRDVVVTSRDTTIQDAARLMRKKHVGSLVIIDRRNGERIPIGLVTDRDLLMEVYALDLDASTVTVGDIMVEHLMTVPSTLNAMKVLEAMREHAVRRLPVVDENKSLVGIVTLDDMLQMLARGLGNLSNAVTHEQTREVWLRPKHSGGFMRPKIASD